MNAITITVAALTGAAVSGGVWLLSLPEPAAGIPPRAAAVDAARFADHKPALPQSRTLPSQALQATPAPAVDRFKLVGVVMPGAPGSKASANAHERFALISVNGGPARAFRPGAVIDGDTVLSDMTPLGATLASRAGGPTLSIPLTAAPTEAAGHASSGIDASGQMVPTARSKHSTVMVPIDSAEQRATLPPPDLGDGRWTR